MPTAPIPIEPMGPAPNTGDTANFDARADALFGAELPAALTGINAASLATFNNAVEAQGYATAAAAAATEADGYRLAAAVSASASAASAGALPWSALQVYADGQRALSLINQRSYVRLGAGSGGLDPALGSPDWRFLAGQRPVFRRVATNATVAAVGEWLGLANVAQTTVTAPPAPAVDDEFWVSPENGLTTNKIGRNGQLIMGFAEDMNIGNASETVKLIFVGGAIGWRLLNV